MHSMDISDALQIVIDLAKQNALTKFDDNADELEQVIADQQEAIKIVEDLAVNEYGDD